MIKKVAALFTIFVLLQVGLSFQADSSSVAQLLLNRLNDNIVAKNRQALQLRDSLLANMSIIAAASRISHEKILTTKVTEIYTEFNALMISSISKYPDGVDCFKTFPQALYELPFYIEEMDICVTGTTVQAENIFKDIDFVFNDVYKVIDNLKSELTACGEDSSCIDELIPKLVAALDEQPNVIKSMEDVWVEYLLKKIESLEQCDQTQQIVEVGEAALKNITDCLPRI